MNAAEKKYEEKHAQATELIAQIADEVFDLPAPDETIHWGNVGTVSALVVQLEYTLKIIRGVGE